ncbi:MAG: peptidylprolyl isomerase [Candidatus Diapherotrites archaeon CG11_big_fil_rev_8_21_14_0_20_37_9]|nr:MAG: peptidylprolyl isomerase [Candidatus Diapherotrites archaeon CG11_big_fil_rev_8_21_14_0_20_37_9]
MKNTIIALILLIVVAGCAQQGTQNQDTNTNLPNDQNSQLQNMNDDAKYGVDLMANTVEKGDKIKVEYVGSFPDTGEIFDKSEGREPLEFEAGAGQMIKGFDDAVIGLKLNDEKTFTIAPADAYGEKGNGQKVQVPVEQITGDGNVTVGMKIYTNTGQEGEILEIVDGNATIIFEHPLAGKTLQFWIKIVGIEKA